MPIHIDFAPIDDCKHPEWTYGEICVKCNECKRFDKPHDFQPVKGVPYRCCAICGIVERRDGKNSPCKGPSKLRPMEGNI